jgi:hypothetical protein
MNDIEIPVNFLNESNWGEKFTNFLFLMELYKTWKRNSTELWKKSINMLKGSELYKHDINRIV